MVVSKAAARADNLRSCRRESDLTIRATTQRQAQLCKANQLKTEDQALVAMCRSADCWLDNLINPAISAFLQPQLQEKCPGSSVKQASRVQAGLELVVENTKKQGRNTHSEGGG